MNCVRVDNQAAVEVLFGSRSRGDHDEASDRDILIVDHRTSLLKQRARILSEQGWSVASYTFRKLQALADRGALFLQHLKMEGKVLHDRDGRYGAILAAYRPRNFYTRDIRENARLAGLLASQPRSEKGALWAADVLYVTVRNFGVLWLAEYGVYTFSYRSIVSELIRRGLVDKAGESALLRLRFLKALYRSGERVPRRYTAEAVGTALLALPPRYFPALSEAMDPHRIIERCRPLPESATAYSRLRNLEKAYVALAGLVDSEGMGDSLCRLDKWIKNPRVYAFAVVRNERDVLARITAEAGSRMAPQRSWGSIIRAWNTQRALTRRA